MSYIRVIPRDLFNEASLLKCVGALWLATEGNPAVDIAHDGEAFEIVQSSGSGAIMVDNVRFSIKGKGFDLYRPLNSRAPWPLWAESQEEDVSGEYDCFPVFDEDGALSEDIVRMMT